MSTPGGSIQEISFDDRLFPVAGDAEATIFLGGMSNDPQANGNGTARAVLERMLPYVEGLQLAVDLDNDDMAFIQSRANNGRLYPFSITMVSGHVYGGSMMITGTPEFNTKNSTAAVNFKGEGELELQ